MNKADKNKWVKIKITKRNDVLLLLYEDGHGNKVNLTGEDFREFSSHYSPPIRIPALADKYLAIMLDAPPRMRDTVQGVRKVPLAIFADISSLDLISPADDLFLLIKDMFASILADKSYQLLFEAGATQPRPFQFPYDISVIGHGYPHIYGQFNKSHWYNDSPFIKDYAIRLTGRKKASLGAVRGKDILIALPGEELPGSFSEADMPPLVILVGKHREASVRRLVRTTGSVMLLDTPNIAASLPFLKDLLDGITNDMSISESLEFALDENEGLKAGDTMLFSSPEANQSLRTTKGVDAFKWLVNESSRTMNPGNYRQFAKKFGPVTEAHILKAYSGADHLPAYFNKVRTFTGKFQVGSAGLSAISGHIAQFHTSVKPKVEQVNGGLTPLVENGRTAIQLQQEQNRVVDATMDELDSCLQYAQKDPFSPLLPAGKYRLNINVGQRSPGSLMVGDAGPVDPMLPAKKNKQGHLLEIIVFPMDFKLGSPANVTVKLPQLGASETASFLLETPDATSSAQLRFGVFSGNYLLQAFLLEAVVNENDHKDLTQQITAKLDDANSKKFTNIDVIGKRDLFLALSPDGKGTHSLFIKGDDVSRDIHGLDELVMKDAQEKFGKLLQTAYFDQNGRQRFPVASKAETDHEPFFSEVRKLATDGQKYYSAIFQGGDKELRARLTEIRTQKDLSFQITRREVNYSFPWSMIYDYTIPPPIAGGPAYPVCMGEPLNLNSEQRVLFASSDGDGCPHNPDIYTYCINGFWGYRHRLEQLLTSETPKDNVSIVKTEKTQLVYANNFTDIASTRLSEKLDAYDPVRIRYDSDLIGMLWNQRSRPSSLVVFGHMQINSIKGEPDEPRILTFQRDTWPNPKIPLPPNKWLYHWLLDSKISQGHFWDGNPRPVVMLISCYNDTLKIGSLNSLIKDFHTAGAAAIVGTECDITSDLGALFIEEILRLLYKEKKSLGEAIQCFNQERFRSYNPLAFAFTCFGSADLKIE